MKQKQTVNLIFRAEEFDLPRRKWGVPLPPQRALDISREGCSLLLDMLDGMGVKATFYVSDAFRTALPGLTERIEKLGHSVLNESRSNDEPARYLALRFLPFDLYKAIYLHKKSIELEFSAWEFCEEIHNTELRVPLYYRKRGGAELLKLLASIIAPLKERGAKFVKF